MGGISRRQFTWATLAAVGASVLGEPGSAAERAKVKLPAVRWGKYEIARVLDGHNPQKGTAHFSSELSDQMREWFDDGHVHGRQLLRRCGQLGINTCQMGGANARRASGYLLRQYSHFRPRMKSFPSLVAGEAMVWSSRWFSVSRS